MKKFTRLCLAIPLLLLAGCASHSTEPPVNTTALTGRRETPWNQPQGWEGMGVLGGFAEQLSTR
ncbi:MAG: hypothetical protein SNJ52_05025 [Verrucomicrobiia bacterium]